MLRFGNFANEGAWLQNLNFPCRIRPSGIWQCAQLSKGWNRFIQDAMQALLFSVMIYSYFFTMWCGCFIFYHLLGPEGNKLLLLCDLAVKQSSRKLAKKSTQNLAIVTWTEPDSEHTQILSSNYAHCPKSDVSFVTICMYAESRDYEMI